MNRRNFLSWLGLAPIVTAVPIANWVEPVRFGVWTVIRPFTGRSGRSYLWCRCICGEERAVGMDQLTSADSRACHHFGTSMRIAILKTKDYEFRRAFRASDIEHAQDEAVAWLGTVYTNGDTIEIENPRSNELRHD